MLVVSLFCSNFAAAMENAIRHDGVVERIEEGHIVVRILQTSACAGCKVAAHCNASETKVKMVDVYEKAPANLNVGDSVVVSTSGATAGKALLLGFGLPLLLLLMVLAVMLGMGFGEGTAALSALAVLIPYYIIIWFCRNRIARSVSFHIED